MTGFEMDQAAFIAAYQDLYQHFQVVERQLESVKHDMSQKGNGSFGPFSGVQQASDAARKQGMSVVASLTHLRNDLAKFLTNAHAAHEAYAKGDTDNAERLARAASGSDGLRGGIAGLMGWAASVVPLPGMPGGAPSAAGGAPEMINPEDYGVS